MQSITSKATRTTEVKSAMIVNQIVESISLSVRISLLVIWTNEWLVYGIETIITENG